MIAVPVAPVSLPLFWFDIEEWIRRALAKAKSDIALDDVHDCIERGDMQLWLANDEEVKGCCITEICESVRGRNCNLVVVAGDDFDAWAHLENDVAAWAKARGCKRLKIEGREGWTRRLSGSGWKTTNVTLEKDIA